MLMFNKLLLNKAETNGNLIRIKFSENILNEILLNRIGIATTKDEIKFYKYKNKLNKLSPLIFNKLKPKVKLISTSVNSNQLPDSNIPEICVYGSYKVGKSSLINAILNKSNLCRTQVKTSKLHFYRVGSPGIVLLVDMPGYSNATLADSDANVDKTSDINETRMIEFCLSYLKYRNNLVLTVILLDSHRGLTNDDLELINYCNHNKLKFLIVLNKCDLIKPIELTKKIQVIRNQLNIFKHQLFPIIPISSTKLQNLDQLRQILTDYISEIKIVNNESSSVKQAVDNFPKAKVNNSNRVTGRATGSIGAHTAGSVDRITNKVISRLTSGHAGYVTTDMAIDDGKIASKINVGDKTDSNNDAKNENMAIEPSFMYKLVGLTPIKIPVTDNHSLNLTKCAANEVKLDVGEDNLIKLNISNLDIINATRDDEPLGDDLINCDNNLIEEKRELFKGKLSNYLFKRYRISQLKLNTSYKRVFSLYKSKLISQTSIIAKFKK
ncbi:uncharacterized protein TOT_030000753 [Theileria orientalis strain Shintoku]|uniref:EngB-type G domain-containing protein n=1 Tax=Theileria orientalis strain Shintoku TaxID=869250 RepID=J4C434_THEOR|nr:uncharacterized protein TOT_030000753 [Theileria orientalis strain Shintoku]BAM41491.1 uncharacterized protein TOT_030000753 [Theileria orientalis strain Shintoku]|eukprot:XP_009691792.1 uncharacterized protein TOT_030000753 [Theileria orientalis strain Shintoku]